MVVAYPMKRSLVYDQQSCQLRVEGLPDLSADHAVEELGILTGWSLRWAGRPELEGQRSHLEALIAAVLPYARHLVSGLRRGFGEESGPVWIGPSAAGPGHTLRLVSGQNGNPCLDLELDDAELADLVRVLDQLRLDPRVKLPLAVASPRPLRSGELIRRIPIQRRLAAPLGGMAALALATALAVLLPPPSRQPSRRRRHLHHTEFCWRETPSHGDHLVRTAPPCDPPRRGPGCGGAQRSGGLRS